MNMKQMIKLTFVMALTCLAAAAQAKNSLQGAWRVTEQTPAGQNAQTNRNPQPGLLIFTGKYYSSMSVNSAQPRPDVPADQAQITPAQALATYGPFTANSGTYEVSGNTLTTHPLVAKNPAAMRGPLTYSFKVDGNTLTLTTTSGANQGAVRKLTRVE
jgi:hypothetical protein